jgi:hypothetical protein
MTDIQLYKQKKKKWDRLESKLIDLISKTDNDELMDAFLDWQNTRNELNEMYCKITSELVENAEKL